MQRFHFLYLLIIVLVVFGYIVSRKPDVKVREIAVASTPTPLPTPIPPTWKTSSDLPKLTAKSYVIFDVYSNSIIVSKNENLRLMPASTTKMMTALVALDEYNPDDIVTLSRATESIGHTINFIPGEQLKTIDMIKAMLINSGNDAAIALADHHQGGYSTFVSLMNEKAVALGLKNTHFSNVSGVEANDHYSSAADLAVIGAEVMKSATLKSIVGTKTTKVQTIDSRSTHILKNLNQLLDEVPGVIGIKTGWTEVAGDCLVTYTSRDHDLITVVLNSQDRFADSKVLIDWAYKNLIW